MWTRMPNEYAETYQCSRRAAIGCGALERKSVQVVGKEEREGERRDKWGGLGEDNDMSSGGVLFTTDSALKEGDAG